MDDSISAIINKYTGREFLLPLLYELNESVNEIDYETIKLISKRFEMSTNDVYSVVTFYPVIKLFGDKINTIYVCFCNNCYIKGSQNIYDYINVRNKSNKINLLKKNLNHRIIASPVLVINNMIHERTKISQIKAIIDNLD